MRAVAGEKLRPAQDATPRVLRLLPISGGIFSQKTVLQSQMPQITFDAIRAAVNELTGTQETKLRNMTLKMCIWKPSDIPLYQTAKNVVMSK